VFRNSSSSSAAPKSLQTVGRRSNVVSVVSFVFTASMAAAVAACTDGTGPASSPDVLSHQPALAKGGNGGSGGSGGTYVAPRIVYIQAESWYNTGSVHTIASDSGQSASPTPITIATTDGSPAWSPDFRKIAFTRTVNDSSFIYVVNASGSGPLKKIGPGYSPRWSPDGSKIAFHNYKEENGKLNGDVYVMSSNGGSVTRLTFGEGPDGQPSWSPDGTKIAFNSRRTGNHEIFIMNADGTDQTKLTKCAIEGANCSAASWSPVPGHNRIVFRYDGTLLGDEFSAIRTISTDGTDLTTVFITPGLTSPVWSPDATRIAFSSLHGFRTIPDIFTIAADGTDLKQVTQGNKRDLYPAWAP
jgi:Tol biopolymer transport system component